MKRTAIVGLLALASLSAQAAPDAPGVRAGMEASFSQFDTLSDSAIGFKLFGQYPLNEWLGIEGAYHALGDFEQQFPNDVPPNYLKVKFTGFSLQGVLYVPWPFDALGWEPFEGVHTVAKAGYYDFSDELSNNTGTTSSSVETGLVAGGGLILDLTDRLGVRAEYEWFDANVGDITSVSIGFEYKFGGAEAAAPLATEPK